MSEKLQGLSAVAHLQRGGCLETRGLLGSTYRLWPDKTLTRHDCGSAAFFDWRCFLLSRSVLELCLAEDWTVAR